MHNIIGSTKMICLLGHPVAHSVSPAMHNVAFDALGLDCVYLAFDITPETLSDAINGLKACGARGCNLTMPLKKAVIPYLDALSDEARLSGSVNTLVNDNGILTGHTTDGIGYVDSLKKEEGFDITGKTVTLLGAGGAAESIITQAALSGAKAINVFKRSNATFDTAASFGKRIADATGCNISVLPMEDADALRHSISDSDLLCNATNVGMGDDTRSLVPKEYLHKDLFVSDIIYHPAQTTLLKDAKSAGCRTANGANMLLYQGAAAFLLWTGCEMPVDKVKSVLRQDL